MGACRTVTGVSRRTAAVLAAGLVWAGAGAAVLTLEVNGIPWETPPPTFTLASVPTPTPFEAATVLAAADAGGGVPAADEVASRLDGLVDAESLGERVGVVVADLASGTTLYDRAGDTAITPASTLKLVTSAAVLRVYGPEHTFRTEVVEGAEDGELILVGGGDPTLSIAERPPLPGATRLEDLADRTAEALAGTSASTVRLSVDDSLFSGPPIDPDWEERYVPNGVVAPTTALAVDGGRDEPGSAARSEDPSLAAAEAFADLLAGHGITVDGEIARADADPDAEPLAAVVSPPLGDVVEHVLATSDNDVAEVLARHVAVGRGGETTSDAAEAAVVTVLEELGVDLPGADVRDGSGLARGSALPAESLVTLLVLAADPAHPELRPVLTGLPVAGFNGTLGERVEDGPGVVRAKTGTLTGVTSLAGVAVGQDGVAYAFAVMADRVGNTLEARAAADAAAAALTACGCATAEGRAG